MWPPFFLVEIFGEGRTKSNKKLANCRSGDNKIIGFVLAK
jgi:hypothetical protein